MREVLETLISSSTTSSSYSYAKADEAHWRQLVAPETKRKLMRLARQLTKNIFDAEDLYGDALLKAVVALQKGQYQEMEGASFSTWVGRIMRHTYYSKLRAEIHQRRVNIVDLKSFALWAATAPAIQEDELAERDVFDKAFARLPPQKRAYISLILTDPEYRDVAEKLGVAVSEIKTKFNRSRVAMRELMEIICDHKIEERPLSCPPLQATKEWREAAGSFVRRERVQRGDTIQDIMADLRVESFQGLSMSGIENAWGDVERAYTRVKPEHCVEVLQETCRLYNLKGMRPNNAEYYEAQDMIATLHTPSFG